MYLLTNYNETNWYLYEIINILYTSITFFFTPPPSIKMTHWNWLRNGNVMVLLNQKKHSPPLTWICLQASLGLSNTMSTLNECRRENVFMSMKRPMITWMSHTCIALLLGRVWHSLPWSSEVCNLPFISLPVEAAVPLYTRVLADKVFFRLIINVKAAD